MRKIKFRAKEQNRRNGKWHYGSIDTNSKDGIVRLRTIEGRAIIVDKDTVGQYTGFNDDNNIEMYDGDIIKIYSESNLYHNEFSKSVEEFITEIIWSNGFLIKYGYGDGYVGLDAYTADKHRGTSVIQIIGNAYDNTTIFNNGQKFEMIKNYCLGKDGDKHDCII